MGWQVHGTNIVFATGEDGIEISGIAKQYPQSPSAKLAPFHGDLTDLEGYWSVYEASRAKHAAGLISLNVKAMKRLLSDDDLAGLKKPVSIITYHSPYQGEAASIGFATFLPPKEFEEFWRLATLLATTDKFRYWINYGFGGIIPNRYDESLLSPDERDNPKRKPIAYQDWLEGAPYYSDDGFGIRLLDRVETEGPK